MPLLLRLCGAVPMCETLEIPLTQPCPIFPFRSPANLKKIFRRGGGKGGRRSSKWSVWDWWSAFRLTSCDEKISDATQAEMFTDAVTKFYSRLIASSFPHSLRQATELNAPLIKLKINLALNTDEIIWECQNTIINQIQNKGVVIFGHFNVKNTTLHL